MEPEYQTIYNRFVTVYLQSCKFTPRTRKEYAWDVESFLVNLQERPTPHLSAVTQNHLKHFLDRNAQNPNTKRRQIASLRAFFAFLGKLGHKNHKIADDLILPDREAKTPECFSIDEIGALEKSVKDHPTKRALVLLLLHTGITLSELVSLKVSDLPLSQSGSFKSNILRIAPPGRHYKARVLPLNPNLIEAIETYLEHQKLPTDSYLFPNLKGARITARGMRDRVKTILRSAGIRGKSPQTFRNTFAARLFARGVDVEIVQQMMGHHSKKTTRRYSEAALDYITSALS